MNAPQRIYMSPPHMSGREAEYVEDVFASNWIAPVGPHLTRFEEMFAAQVGLRAAVALSSGTAALHLALRHLRIQPGDEVVCPTFTFCATANPITYDGGVPVLIDIDPQTWTMDPGLLEAELREADLRGKLPKAIVPVDLLGQSADMTLINEIADRYQIPVVEDAAEALGATYQGKPAGSTSWVAAYSFNGNKIITTSGGGMLASDDVAAIEHVRHLSTQAKEPGPLYRHDEIGFNYRMSNVCAAIGIGQLELLAEKVAKRKSTYEFYRNAFASTAGIGFMPYADYGTPNYWLSTITVDADQFGATCEDIRLALEAENIESRRTWMPLHMQAPFASCRCHGGKVAERIFESSLCLPSGTALTEDDLSRVVACIEGVAR